MTRKFSSFWPDDLVSEVPAIPIAVVNEQAAHLGRLTNNIVQAAVNSYTDKDGDFWIEFGLTSPAVGKYKYQLFAVWHGIELYPVTVTGENHRKLESEEELAEFMRDVFNNPRTVRIVRALLAQARAMKPEDDIPF